MVRWISGTYLSLSIMTLALTASSQAQPLVEPGPEHDVLKAMEGTWDAVMKMGAEETKGVMTYQMDLGGLWLLSTFEGEFTGMKFKGHGIDGYNPMKKKYVSVWVDSWTPTVLNLEGDWDKESKTLTMAGDPPGPNGETAKVTMITKWTNQDQMEFTMFGPGPDGKQMEMMVITYTRRS